jgi:hypothetical protein
MRVGWGLLFLARLCFELGGRAESAIRIKIMIMNVIRSAP